MACSPAVPLPLPGGLRVFYGGVPDGFDEGGRRTYRMAYSVEQWHDGIWWWVCDFPTREAAGRELGRLLRIRAAILSGNPA